MDAELYGKIKEIGGLLGIDDIPEGVGDIIGSFLGDSDNSCEETNALQTQEEKQSEGSIDPMMLIDMFSKVKNLQEKNQNDDKVRLLKALRPFLGSNRQKRVDTCVNLIMLKDLAPLFGK